MGRHGGGSRSGGGGSSSGSSRSSGGSRGSSSSGGETITTSNKPFKGAYNRSYCDRFGRMHMYYTTDSDFGTKSGWDAIWIFILIFITIHMIIMIGGFTLGFVTFGSKVNGDANRIFIEDKIDLLTEDEESELLELFEKVYKKSGMPITLYTDDFSWKQHYDYLEVYSEELYYKISSDEDAMLILFTAENENDFFDWEYDMYCGDDTVKCFSDEAFDKLLDKFQKSMSNQDLKLALVDSWNFVIKDLAKTTMDPVFIPILLFMLLVYGSFYIPILTSIGKKNDAYRYFKKHPEALSGVYTGNDVQKNKMNVAKNVYRVCPICNEDNSEGNEKCKFCGNSLIVEADKSEMS